MNITHAIYQPGSISIQAAVYKLADGVMRAAYTAPRPFDALHLVENADRPAADYLRDLNATRKEGEPEYKLIPWDEALKAVEIAEEEKVTTDWQEISKETWNTMLEILPPCRWQTVQGVELFYISEAYTSNFHEHYARLRDRYFHRRCRTSVPYTVLAQEVAQFADSNPCKYLPFCINETLEPPDFQPTVASPECKQK